MNRLKPTRSWTPPGWLLPILLTVAIGGCVEEVITPAVFDVVLESTTFENRLRAPVIIFRDGTPIDTMPAGSSQTYPLNRRGAVRHAWRLISPFDASGAKAGEEPFVDLRVQYQVRQTYRITNSITGTGNDIFTPQVSNGLNSPVRLAVNYGEEDQRITNYLIPPRTFSNLDSAPYYYWHSSSNVVLSPLVGTGSYYFTRDDTTGYRLELDNGLSPLGANLKDAGVTTLLEVP